MSTPLTNQPMQTHTLSAERDPMGAAILDYQKEQRAGRLRVRSTMFEDDEMPVAHLFRNESEMPLLEQKALSLARGRILDVGAGAGCHALALQQRGMEVKAIDISPLSCEAMRLRGVRDVQCINLFDPRLTPQQTAFPTGFDTILLLMNGTGIAGKVSRLPMLLMRLRDLLAAGGQVLVDSSDLRYIYEDEEGHMDIDPKEPYYGEVDYQMVYKNLRGKTIEGDSFDWLYADFGLLQSTARACAMGCELVAEGDHYDYLARLWREA